MSRWNGNMETAMLTRPTQNQSGPIIHTPCPAAMPLSRIECTENFLLARNHFGSSPSAPDPKGNGSVVAKSLSC
eukprot:5251821-Amphidinium_carterae.1